MMETNNGTNNKKKEIEYEFGGPIGTTVNIFLLPVLVLLLGHWASVGFVDLSCLNFLFSQDDNKSFWKGIVESPVFCPGCLDGGQMLLKCTLGVLAWFLFQAVLERIVPGEVVEGTLVKNSNPPFRLPYRINGHLAFWLTMIFVAVGWPRWISSSGSTENEIANGLVVSFGGAPSSNDNVVVFGQAPLALIHDNYAVLGLSTIVLSCILSVYLYLRSFKKGTILAEGGNSGNDMYDFFMGRVLNPRWGSFDWKEFCELRPGLIGWMLLNLGCMAKQHEQLGYVSGSMLLVNIFQAIYVWDAQFQEKAILTTMDITTDGFGYMLVFGDLAWVPFTYSLQARYLVNNDPNLDLWALAAIVTIYMIGYYIFRGANSQKDAFRTDPTCKEVAHLKFLKTKRGTKLLTSGWWGMARKINYTGDWIMGLSWCLTCGFGSVVPYFYAIYFFILLIHRSIRDDHMCQEKYGDDWQKYKKLVPYRFVPGLFWILVWNNTKIVHGQLAG